MITYTICESYDHNLVFKITTKYSSFHHFQAILGYNSTITHSALACLIQHNASRELLSATAVVAREIRQREGQTEIQKFLFEQVEIMRYGFSLNNQKFIGQPKLSSHLSHRQQARLNKIIYKECVIKTLLSEIQFSLYLCQKTTKL